MKARVMLKIEEVTSMLGLSVSMVYKLMKNGEFPRPAKLGTASRWPAEQVEKWLEEKIGEVGNGY